VQRSTTSAVPVADISDAAEALGDVLTFMRLLWAVDHGLRSASKRLASVAGVTGPQRLVLRMVGRFPSASAGELAELLHVHPSTLTGVLDRLERRGLLQRREDPKDGRRSLFRLTAKGETVDAMRAGTVEDAVRRVLARLSQNRVASAREVLSALAAELGGSAPSPRSSPKPKRRRS
jgi:MarR family transcriptional regulator, organic hydroperoxide resistance regulator